MRFWIPRVIGFCACLIVFFVLTLLIPVSAYPKNSRARAVKFFNKKLNNLPPSPRVVIVGASPALQCPKIPGVINLGSADAWPDAVILTIRAHLNPEDTIYYFVTMFEYARANKTTPVAKKYRILSAPAAARAIIQAHLPATPNNRAWTHEENYRYQLMKWKNLEPIDSTMFREISQEYPNLVFVLCPIPSAFKETRPKMQDAFSGLPAYSFVGSLDDSHFLDACHYKRSGYKYLTNSLFPIHSSTRN